MNVAVVVLNWQNPGDTVAALDSLFRADPRPQQVVVVDNASRDDSVERLERWGRDNAVAHRTEYAPLTTVSQAWLTILRAPENRGFAIGNNHALRYLRDRTSVSHVFLLNNDARVRMDCFAELASAVSGNPAAGLVTGTIFVDDGTGSTVWYAGGEEIPLRALTRHRTSLPSTDDPRPTEFVSGCAMLISRPVLERVGLLAECYEPFYVEDAEYSRRVRRAGYPLIYAPRAIVYHKVGATIGPADRSAAVTYSQVRHRFFFVRRNFRGMERFGALAYMVVTKPGRVVIELLRGRPHLAGAVARGTVAGIFHPARG